MENATRRKSNGDDDGFERPATQDEKKDGSNAGQGYHKKSISGSILGNLPLMKSSTADAVARHVAQREEERPGETGQSAKRAGGSSIAQALRQSQGRKRKGSLRKTLLLRERRNSVRKPNPAPVHTQMSSQSPDDEPTPRRFSYEKPPLNSSSDSESPQSGDLSVSTTTGHSLESHDHSATRTLASPLTSPVGPYASTTDDDEGLSFFRPSASSNGSSYSQAQLPPLGLASSLQRRRSNRSGQQSSLTIVHTPADLALDEEWDYSETEWWGWVVLIATWIVFVVGMGSCLGVWSWAWDVGETPYAPPELEDDPTLPITGYYPALMVCTAVMAWVWVVVAWVGMKYFRHAKEG